MTEALQILYHLHQFCEPGTGSMTGLQLPETDKLLLMTSARIAPSIDSGR